MHVCSSLGDFLEIFKLTSSRDVIEWQSVEFTVYQYAQIAKIRPEAQGIGDSRTELICMALFHSFKLVILCGTACSPRRSNSAIVYNRESSALFLLLRG